MKAIAERAIAERDEARAQVEHLRHAMQDADKMADDPVVARAILRAARTAYRTRLVRSLTDAEIEALAKEAERGYDVDALGNSSADEST